VLDAVGSNHLDVDVEAAIPHDMVNTALKRLQTERGTSISYTMRVQGDDYGMDPYSVQILQNAAAKSDAELKRLLGVTPMIGRNFNGKVFTQAHARKLVARANTNRIGLLGFWSVGRDNGTPARAAASRRRAAASARPSTSSRTSSKPSPPDAITRGGKWSDRPDRRD
jgi:hypothetical protein